MRRNVPPIRGLLLLLSYVLIAGCATEPSGPVPVIDRSTATVPTGNAAVPAVADPGYHVVQRGETVYSIARQHGQDPKSVIAWNNLENPGALTIGKRIRIAPPAPAEDTGKGVVEVKPVNAGSGIEVRPLGPVGGTTVPGSPDTAGLKREPRGGKQPYSERAWQLAQSGDDKTAAAVSVKPEKSEAQGETRPEKQPEVKPETKPEAKAPDKATTPLSDGTIDWGWPAGGKIVGNFVEGSNKGVDIGGKVGDPVLAAAPGKVIYAGQDLRGYGKLVVVKHNPQFLSVYAHNNEILVQMGQTVNKGQKIAELGKSDAEQPKLHFEIRKQGKPVDPAQFLPPR